MNTNFVHVVEMTDEEKFKMYMKCKKADIVRMHIELEKHVKPVRFAPIPNSTGNPPIEFYLGIDNSQKIM